MLYQASVPAINAGRMLFLIGTDPKSKEGIP